MGHRPHVYVSVIEPCYGGDSPNNYLGQVTAEIRLYFPPLQRDLAAQALTEAVKQAWREFDEHWTNGDRIAEDGGLEP